MRSGLSAFGLVSLLVFVPVPVWAGAPTDQLQTAVQQVIQILDDPTLKADGKAPERQAAVRSAIVDLFDFAEVSRRALGRHWRSLGETEREEFIGIFRAFLESKYLPQIKLYEGERVHFVGERVDGHLASVMTRLKTRRRPDVPVTFRLHRLGDRWLIYDVMVEGISLIRNYRVQFDRVIRRASYQGLVARMKQKLTAPTSPDEEIPGRPGSRQ